MIVTAGKSTRIALGLASALALIPIAGRAADAPANTCHLGKIAEVPVRVEDNRPEAQVTINGQTAWFIIDTGSTNTLMFGGAAQALKLNTVDANETEFYGVGGKQSARATQIASFKLGNAEAKNLRVYVVGKGGSADDAGVIGEDFLGQADLEFDLANHVFRLWKPSHCGSQSLAYWTQTPEVADMRHIDVQNDIEIEVHVNGRKVDAILDSGATTSLITSAAAQAAGVREKDYSSETKDVAGLGPKVITSRVAVFDVVTIGDEQIKNAKLRVGDFFTGASEAPIGSHIARQSLDTPQMMLGADFFRSHRVLMVNSQRRMYFTYSGGPVFQVVGDAGKPTDAAAKTPVSAAPEPAKP